MDMAFGRGRTMDENLIKEGRMLRRRRFFCYDVIFWSQNYYIRQE